MTQLWTQEDPEISSFTITEGSSELMNLNENRLKISFRMIEALQDGSYRSMLEDLDPRAGKLFVNVMSYDKPEYFKTLKIVPLETRLCTAEDFEEPYRLGGDFCMAETEKLALQGSSVS